MSMLTGLTTIRMLPWVRLAGYALWLLLAVTGVWWWWDQDIQMNDPTERASLLVKLHGIAAAFALVWFGSILSTHVRVAWQRKRNRVSGLLALVMMALLGLSGLGLYYADYDSREWVHDVHVWVGAVALLMLPVHVVLGRMKRGKAMQGTVVGRHVRD